MKNASEKKQWEQQLREDIEAYSDGLMRTCYMMLRDRQMAEDAVQEAFLRAWKHREETQGMAARQRRAWLTATALNICRDMRRTRWFRGRARQLSIDEAPPELLAAEEEDRALLMDVLRLPEKFRQVILLRYYQGFTLRESAKALGISAPAVNKRLSKAEQMLKGQLTGRDEHDK